MPLPSQPAPPPEQSRETMRRIVLGWINEEVTSPVVADQGIPEHKATVPPTRELPAREEKQESSRPPATAASVPHVARPTAQPATDAVRSSRQRRRLTVWGRLYGVAWAVLGGGVATLAVGVYGFGWDTPLVNRLLLYVPLPYGFVRYHPMWYGAWRQEYDTLRRFYAEQRRPADAPPVEEEIQRILIRRAIANDLAWSYGLWVSDTEVTAAFARIAGEAGSPDRVESTLQSLWGIDTRTYKQRVLRPYLLKQKLLEELKRDPVTSRDFGEESDLRQLDAYLDKVQATRGVRLLR